MQMPARTQLYALAVLLYQRYPRKPLNSKVDLNEVNAGTKPKISGIPGSTRKTTIIQPAARFTN
jgi:hypothetical protein